MGSKGLLADYPDRIVQSTAHPDRHYRRIAGYAVHGRKAGTPAQGADFVLEDGAIAVYRGEPRQESLQEGSHATPVYGLDLAGPPAVPTGKIFVRFAEGVSVESRAADFARAGYRLCHSLPYAPHAGWLEAQSDNPADALTGIPALESLADINNVEPQMLAAAASR